MSDLNLDELERLAERAEPGPWCHEYLVALIRHGHRNMADALCDCTEWARHPGRYDGGYIAAASPAVILALIARVRQLEAENYELRCIAEDVAQEVGYCEEDDSCGSILCARLREYIKNRQEAEKNA